MFYPDPLFFKPTRIWTDIALYSCTGFTCVPQRWETAVHNVLFATFLTDVRNTKVMEGRMSCFCLQLEGVRPGSWSEVGWGGEGCWSHYISSPGERKRTKGLLYYKTSRRALQSPISSRKAPLHKLLQPSKTMLPARDRMSKHTSP